MHQKTELDSLAVSKSEVRQPLDDQTLMELMIEDGKNIPPLYKPTVYWQRFQEELENELRTKGLRDFRRRRNTILNRFGATDIDPIDDFLYNTKETRLLPLQIKLKIQLKLNQIFGRNEYKSRFKSTMSYGKRRNAKSLSLLEASEVGNPENIFEIEGRKYTTHLLQKYIEYAYCCKFINFNSINTIMELGAGGGKQVEVIKKLHPHVCFYLFDIAPEQYVCQQYLSALFPGDVISYRETRDLTALPEPEKGKIFVFGNWKLPEIKNLEYDLFWNSASLDETELPVAQNYLSFVNNNANYVYLKMSMKGVRGVKEPVTLLNCKSFMSNFELIDVSKILQIPKLLPFISYRFSLWRRKTV